MAWIASTPAGRREQFGPYLLGTGNIGGIALSTGQGLGLSPDEGRDLMDRAVDEGVRVFDTADAYAGGASEKAVGQWFADHPDSEVLVQTKTGATLQGPNLAPERIKVQLAASQRILGRIDLFVTHRFDPHTPWSDSLPVLSEAVADGRIRAYGLSNVTDAQLTSALETADRLGLARPEVVQNPYSLLVRDDEASVLEIVASEGLAYTPYSPLANGLLTGRYSHGEPLPHGSRADNSPNARAVLSRPGAIEQLQRFDELAIENGTTSAVLAQAWVRSRPGVTAYIAGISKESHWTAQREVGEFGWRSELTDHLDDLFPVAEPDRGPV